MIWYVAAGGAVGSVSRYLLGTFIQQRVSGTFPVGTLVINITGSFLLGFLLRYALETPAASPEIRALLTVGFCGGYTTFSAFSYEALMLIEDGQYERAALYVALSVTISLVATYLGLIAARELLAIHGRM